jgi:hypothetical protein
LDDKETEIDEPTSILEITGRYYWHQLMILSNRDLTKVEEILKLPLVLSLNFLAEEKDIYEKEKKELNKLKRN